MSHVSKETEDKLDKFMQSLSEESFSKCALCNETLTHITKLAEAETGAGTFTVTRALSHLINKTAAANDKISGKALNNRVRRNEGKDVKNPNRENNEKSDDQTEKTLLEKEGRDKAKDAKSPSRENSNDSEVINRPTRTEYTPPKNHLDSEATLKTLISGRDLVIQALDNLRLLRDKRQLESDRLFQEFERHLNLINSHAKDLGMDT